MKTCWTILLGAALFLFCACEDVSSLVDAVGDRDLDFGDIEIGPPCDTSFDCDPGYTCMSGYCIPTNPNPNADEDSQTEETPSEVPGGSFTIDETLINFGAVIMGKSDTKTVTAGNIGDSELRIITVELDHSSSAEFQILDAPTEEVVLDPGDTLPITIRYTPINEGADEGLLQFHFSGDPLKGKVEIPVFSQYKGVPNIVVEPDSIDFEKVPVGGSDEKCLTVTNEIANEENMVLNVLSLEYSTVNSGFEGVDLPSFPLQILPHESKSLCFRFAPHSPGLHETTLTIVNDDPESEDVNIDDTRKEIAFKGMATIAQLEVTENPVNFARVKVDQDTVLDVTLKNIGEENLIVTEISLTDDGEGAFRISDPLVIPNGGLVFTPSQEETFKIAFNPSDVGAYEGSFTVYSNDYYAQQTAVGLSGYGTISRLTVRPSSRSFDDTPVGSSNQEALVFENEGEAPVTVYGLGFTTDSVFSPSDPDDFPFLLEVQNYKQVWFDFTPRLADEYLEHVPVYSDDSGDEFDITFSGSGIAPTFEITPPGTLLDFGAVIVDKEASKTLTITNNGTYDLEVLDLLILQDDGGPFRVVPGSARDALAFNVPPGESQTIEVFYEPTQDEIPDQATMVMCTNDPSGGEPVNCGGTNAREYRFTLVGHGTKPTLNVDPNPEEPLDFSRIIIGTQSPPVHFVVTNTGTGSLKVLSVEVTGAQASRFGIVGLEDRVFPVLLDNHDTSGESLAFDVVFTPLNEETSQASLRIIGEGYGTSAENIDLVGEGYGCPSQTHNCGQQCVSNSDPDHCGTSCTPCEVPANAVATCDGVECGYRCDEDYSDCNGESEDGCEAETSFDPEHCGHCDTSCLRDNAYVECVEANCIFLGCEVNWRDCNDDMSEPGSDGCEIDITQNSSHCGRCYNQCSIPHGISQCENKTCVFVECEENWGDCNNNAHILGSDGCETNLLESSSHCGICNTSCVVQNGTSECMEGGCLFTGCNSGYGDCNDNADITGSDGCEERLNTIEHCGECDNGCAFEHASARCVQSECFIDRCEDNWGDCDEIQIPIGGGSRGNGCETDLTSNPDYCGGCDRNCVDMYYFNSDTVYDYLCQSRKCLINNCQHGYGDCDGMVGTGCEQDTLSTVNHCGACNNRCTYNAWPNVQQYVCNEGLCEIYACVQNDTNRYMDCNLNPLDGCEADLNSNPNHCNSCNNRCDELPHVQTGQCIDAECHVEFCDAGWADCKDNVSGCETEVLTNMSNCGGCGIQCVFNNSQGHCVDGECNIEQCAADYYRDCNENGVDGCESDVRIDEQNCGECGNECVFQNTVRADCFSGNCMVYECSEGFDNCDEDGRNGCEIDLQNDIDHCGDCLIACQADHAVSECTEGECEIRLCLDSWVDANGDYSDGCECQDQGYDDFGDGFDTNCDGVDGDAANIKFVVPYGDGSGTRDDPMGDIQQAINNSSSGGMVWISRGTYNGKIILKNGVHLIGGFDVENDWSQASGNTVTLSISEPEGPYNRQVGMYASGITASTYVEHITVSVSRNYETAASNFGVWMKNCTENLHFRNVTIVTDKAGNGAYGQSGTAGEEGGDGAVGQEGCESSGGVFCGSCADPEPGLGGLSPCNAKGGRGGDAGVGENSYGGTGRSGINSSLVAANNGGGGGDPSDDCREAHIGDSSCEGCDTCTNTNGEAGYDGADGARGNHGTSGSSSGERYGDYWRSTWAGNGESGSHGVGGGGGGGGGGGCHNCDSTGSAGSGGGGGGCAGTGGTGGQGGGGSFGVFMINSFAVFESCSIESGPGGDGGRGGYGGTGGDGGDGGGSPSYGGSDDQDDGGCGGVGGDGGRGGNGGDGGGGGGGPSFGMYLLDDSVPVLDSTVPHSQGGGNGGSSGAAANYGETGPDGATGP